MEGEDNDPPVEIPSLILFVFCFFTVWNMIICMHTVKAFSGIIRGEFNEAIPTLFCPHWIVGIAIPMYVGYSWNGFVGLLFCSVPFIVPHAIGVMLLKYKARAVDQPVPIGSAATQTRADSSGQGAAASEAGSGGLRNMSEAEMIEYVDKILISKKVVSGGGIDVVPAGGAESLRCRDLKSDIIVAPEREKEEKSIVDQVFPSVSGEQQPDEHPPLSGEQPDDEEKSSGLCSICLEGYRVGEEIYWSKNPECAHVFHKKCLLAWLGTDMSCPNCRLSYIGDFCRIEPEP